MIRLAAITAGLAAGALFVIAQFQTHMASQHRWDHAAGTCLVVAVAAIVIVAVVGD